MATRLEGLLLEREFERLYRLHRREVYRSALRSVRDPDEAEDVTQAAFLDAYRALRRGDEPLRPRAWLLTIAQNVARRRYRARAAGPREVELDVELLVAPDEAGPTAVEIRQAFAHLGPRQRQALALREIAGRSYAEIAAALDLSVPAVETLLFRARRALRRELTGWEPVSRTRRRLGLIPWPPAQQADATGSLAGWAAKHGAAAKFAGALSAAALGTGLVLENVATPSADSAAERPAPRELAPGRAAAAAYVSQAPEPRRPARPRAGQTASAREPARAPKPATVPLAVPPLAAEPVTLVEQAVSAGGARLPVPLPVPDEVDVPPTEELDVPALPKTGVDALPDALP